MNEADLALYQALEQRISALEQRIKTAERPFKEKIHPAMSYRDIIHLWLSTHDVVTVTQLVYELRDMGGRGGSFRQAAHRMIVRGELVRVGPGVYRLPEREAS